MGITERVGEEGRTNGEWEEGVKHCNRRGNGEEERGDRKQKLKKKKRRKK